MFIILVAALLAGQQADDTGQQLDLPVSLDRIRAALAQSAGELKLPPDRPADFVVYIREHHLDEHVLPLLDFRSGPVPPGGLYAFEQRQRLGVGYMQQPLVSVDLLAIGRAITSGISQARRAAAERAAREEVRRALAEFCAEHDCSPR